MFAGSDAFHCKRISPFSSIKTEKINYVPIYQKATLTIKEASKYSNIGINKIDAMLREPNCPFVLFVGVKKLVKRKEFEEFISKALII